MTETGHDLICMIMDIFMKIFCFIVCVVSPLQRSVSCKDNPNTITIDEIHDSVNVNTGDCHSPSYMYQETFIRSSICEPSRSHREDSSTSTMTANNALALVPYDDSFLLPLHKASQEFKFAGETIVIQQDWTGLGVAAVVWDSAVVLCEYMQDNRDSITGKRVLELGAGTGLVGIVAAYLGAEVTITERQLALKHITSVVHENIQSQDIISRVKIEELDWTDENDSYNSHDYDIILGADIIYIEEVFDDLLRTLLKLTNTTSNYVLLSCKIRYDRDQRFLDMLKQYFSVTEVLYDKSRDIRIYKAVKK